MTSQLFPKIPTFGKLD